MNKENLIRKLSSRKLWLAVALFISGLITALLPLQWRRMQRGWSQACP